MMEKWITQNAFPITITTGVG